MAFQIKIPGFSREDVSSPELDEGINVVLAFTARAVDKLNNNRRTKEVMVQMPDTLYPEIPQTDTAPEINETMGASFPPAKTLDNRLVSKITNEVVYDGRKEAEIADIRQSVDEIFEEQQGASNVGNLR